MAFKSALMGQPRAFNTDGGNINPPSAEVNSQGHGSGTLEGGLSVNSSSRLGMLNGVSHSLSTVLIAHHLNGNNYLQWSRSVLMFVQGKDKEKYLTRSPASPSPDSAQYAIWSAENNMVMTWLVNSMTADISENYLLATSAKEIWDSAKMTYLVRENTVAVTQVKHLLRNLIQERKTVTQYYTALMKLWQQIDLYEVHEWTCTKDGLYFRQYIDRERCYEFLLGLNDVFEDIRRRIMGMKPFPSLEGTFNLIKCEESRKMLTQNASTTTHKMSALAVQGNSEESKGKKSEKWCDHCSKGGHTKDKC